MGSGPAGGCCLWGPQAWALLEVWWALWGKGLVQQHQPCSQLTTLACTIGGLTREPMHLLAVQLKQQHVEQAQGVRRGNP